MASIKINYVKEDPIQVKRAFDTLMVWTNMDVQKVLESMRWNPIAVAEAESWELTLKSKVSTFNEWVEGIWVTIGQDYYYQDIAYTVIQSHTTQIGWEPPNVPALFKKKPIVKSGENYPMWVQPLGSTDAYAQNDRVTHNGEDWESDIADNVFEPGVSSWTSLSNPPAGPEPWVQPTGAQDAYNTGDQVTHNGSTWESTVDANVWEPGVFGWVQI